MVGVLGVVRVGGLVWFGVWAWVAETLGGLASAGIPINWALATALLYFAPRYSDLRLRRLS